MIFSMTGYGKAESQLQIDNKKIVVEVRSLNSKSLDLNVRIAPPLRDKELELRSMVAQRLERGKIDLSIYYQLSNETSNGAVTSYTPINRDAFTYYYRELRALQKDLGWANDQDIVAAILRIPEVTKPIDNEDVSEEEWQTVLMTLQKAIGSFIAFRQQEGISLQAMFCEKLETIASLLSEVEPYEQSRIEKIKARIETNLEQLSANTQQAIDRNRLEQEMIYYLEKLDITEEKVRLTNHIRYFHETMNSEGAGVGKKLGFIAQEMGREINTLGSKSNQSEMQIIVVKMKDILEQIKEQILNVL